MTLKMEKYEYDSQNWFFQYYSQNWTCFFVKMTFFSTLNFFFNTTQRIEILQYNSEDSTFFPDMTQSIELFLYDSLNWTFFFKKYDLTHRIEPLSMNFFFKMTQRVEVFLSDSKNWTFLVFQCDSKNWNVSSQNVSKNLTSLSCELFFTWLKELNFFFLNMTQKNWTLF